MAYRPAGAGARQTLFNSRASSTPHKLSTDFDEEEDGDDDEDDEAYSDGDGPDSLLGSLRRPTARGVVAGITLLVLASLLVSHAIRSSQRPPPEALSQVPSTTPVREAMPVLLPPTTTRNPLLPAEDLHDRNVCEANEELYGGLCYMKCSSLTHGSHPIRTSSWTCCESHPCGIHNQVGRVGSRVVCNGFDVSGGSAGGCPHRPGACLTNEELFLGECYEKCATLTQGRFPTRAGPATCCASQGLGCFDIRKDRTDAQYNVGGGGGDHDALTPGTVHAPLLNLTKSGGAAALSKPVSSVGSLGEGARYSGWGARCAGDEELYAGLCYRKCADLTAGAYPIRSSSWTCCANHPCGFGNQKGKVGSKIVCTGFDVGGTLALKVGSLSCPHKPTPCAPDEEEHLGACYKSCNALTQGRFPHRVAAATCCKEDSILACLNVYKTSTSSSYDTH